MFLRSLPMALAAALLFAPTLSPARDLAAPLDFKGTALVALSDADMVASAYVNGQLGPREGRDALTVIALGAHARDLKASPVEVSNSVAGPPVAVAVSPGGQFAVVVETFTPRPDDNREHTFGDLRQGSVLTVVDISDRSAPRVVQRLAGPQRPDAVSFNARGDLVAISVHPQGDGSRAPLALYDFRTGRLSNPRTPAIPGWQAGDRLIHAEFHPRENLLALVNETRAELSFVEVNTGSTGAELKAHGNKVQVEKSPYMARFTPDGRHVIVNGLYWGSDVQGQWNEAPLGSVVSVRLDAEVQGQQRRHALISRAQTGVSPEGLAISPDGTMVVTTNLERSFLPYDDPRITWYSSLTLVKLDPTSGQLNRVGDFAYDGILPEAAAFDASSRYLAVVTYDHFNDRRQGGSVDFWRIQRDPLDTARLSLVKTEHSVPVARGAHSMVLVR